MGVKNRDNKTDRHTYMKEEQRKEEKKRERERERERETEKLTEDRKKGMAEKYRERKTSMNNAKQYTMDPKRKQGTD